MSIATNTPSNANFLSPLGFKFQIKKAPNVNFFVQSVVMPSITLGTAYVPTPFTRQPFAGDHLEYGDLSVTFKMDEDLKSYMEIHNWLVGIGKPDNFDQYKDLTLADKGEGVYSDLTLTILSSAMRPIHEVVFMDAFPIDLTALAFDTRLSAVDYLEATCTFKFRKYTITTL
jgi:hypothetical protein